MKGFEEEAKQWLHPGQENPADQKGEASNTDPASGAAHSTKDEYDEFLQSLIVAAEVKLANRLDNELQDEFAALVAVMVEMPRKQAYESRVFFEFAFKLLAAEDPNLTLVRTIRQELSNVNDRSSHGLLRIVSFISGSTRLNAAITALIAVVLFSLFILWIMIATHQELLHNVESSSVLASMLNDGSVELLTIFIHAAFVGGVVSIVARIQDFVDGNTFSPALVFISVFRKPFLGAAFSVMVFAALKTELVSFPGVDLSGADAPYFAWAIGFLCGFSERFVQDYVVSTEGRFG